MVLLICNRLTKKKTLLKKILYPVVTKTSLDLHVCSFSVKTQLSRFSPPVVRFKFDQFPSFWVPRLHVVPILLQQRDQEVDGHQTVLPQLIRSHAHVAHGHAHAQHLSWNGFWCEANLLWNETAAKTFTKNKSKHVKTNKTTKNAENAWILKPKRFLFVRGCRKKNSAFFS